MTEVTYRLNGALMISPDGKRTATRQIYNVNPHDTVESWCLYTEEGHIKYPANHAGYKMFRSSLVPHERAIQWCLTGEVNDDVLP